MPDPPFPPKLRRPTPQPAVRSPAAPPPDISSGDTDTVVSPQVRSGYAELHCLTNYCFLEGASHPDELVQEAANLGLSALAITDRNSLAGVVRAHVAAKATGLKLLIGAEITPTDSQPVLLWAQNRTGYGRLARLLTIGHQRAQKGSCLLTLADIAHYSEGLLAGVLLVSNHTATNDRQLQTYREIFGDRCYAVAELHHGPNDRRLLAKMLHNAQLAGLPVVAANDVHYHTPRRRYLQEVLTAIRLGCSVAELGHHRFPNAERSLKARSDMNALFANHPDCLDRTIEVASRCQFSLDELRYDYPEELCPHGETPAAYLSRLTWAGAANRYPEGIPEKVCTQVNHELNLITDLNYEAYFLTVWDLVRFARSKGILCQGRGSAANSAVCFCLGVTSVDPDRMEVLFERFISKERDEAPDIDIDFEHQRREEVLQYVYNKYGRERAGMTAEVITYRTRSAVRDIGKALGISLDRVDSLAKSTDYSESAEGLAARFREVGFQADSRLGQQLIYLVQEILGFPRHLSQHVGGMVLTNRPLCELVPIENASMPGRTVIQWDKDDLDALGILKVDCLALGMLSAIRGGLGLIRKHYGRSLSLATVPAEDPLVYAMIQKAETVGVFQIESRAQMSMLPRLKPKTFYDLVIEVAIVRPGPIQGNMVHPYLRRKNGEELPDYPKEELRCVLSRTLGVPLFQEQAMKLVVIAAGFTPGEADQLRRAMGAWRKTGVIEKFRQKMLAGMRQNGYTDEFAERLFKQISGFGEYGFPESHAASFALLVYVSAWIKRHYPDVFLATLLNSQPMGFYAPAQLVADAQKNGVRVLPVDVNFSEWDCTLESSPELNNGNGGPSQCASFDNPVSPQPGPQFAVRLGWRMVSGLPSTVADHVVACRQAGPFRSYDDFVFRTGFHTANLSKFARADAFGSLQEERRPALWSALAHQEASPLFDGIDQEGPTTLPVLSESDEVFADYESTGLSLRSHPLQFVRSYLNDRGIVTAASLLSSEPDRRYELAGLVLLRQRPSTAKGITFMTLEDETGTANLIIHRNTWEKFRSTARRAGALIARGILQRDAGVVHLVVDKLENFTREVHHPKQPSRDFR